MTKTRKDGDETRRRLLDAAASVFAKQGYHNAKTADICRLAKANIAAVHYHFRSKENLYAEAWRHAFELSIRAFPPDGGVLESAPPEERLKGQIHALLHRLMDPDNMDFAITNKEMANPTGLLHEVMRRSIEPLHQTFTAIVRALLGDKASGRDVHLCEMSIHAQCFAPLIHERQRRERGSDEPPHGHPHPPIGADALADHIIRFSLAGIRGVQTGTGRKPGRLANRQTKA